MSTEATTETQTQRIAPADVTGFFAPREEFSDGSLEDLAKSLAEEQEDNIVVRETDDGVEVVDGERRVMAMIEFGDDYGIDSLDADIRDMDDVEAARHKLVSDVFHEPLTYMEEARLVNRIAEEGDFDTQQEVADYIGKSNSWVSKKLSRLDDPAFIQEAGEEGAIDENTASQVSQAAEEAPEAAREAIDYARENPEASRDDVSKRLQEAQERDRDTSEVRELVESAVTLQQEVSERETQVETREQLQAEKERLEANKREVKTQAPEDLASRYEELQEQRQEAANLAEATEVADQTADMLDDRANDVMPEASQQEKMQDYARRIREIQEEYGRPTEHAVDGDSAPVTVKEMNDGGELWEIRVVVENPDDPPEAVAELRDALEEYAEKKAYHEDKKSAVQRAEHLADQAQNIRVDVGHVLTVDQVDVDDINQSVIGVLEEYEGESPSKLRELSEELQDEIEAADTDELRDAWEEHQDIMDRIDEIDARLDEIDADMPPRNVSSNLSQKSDKLEDTRAEAREALETVPEDAQEALIEELQADYDVDLSWLAGEETAEEETPDVDIEEGGGGHYYVRADGEEIHVRGEDTAEHVAETWERDGFDAAQEAAG